MAASGWRRAWLAWPGELAVMGRTHGLSGLSAGLGLGAVTGSRPEICLFLGGVCLLGAYVPDIDHRNSEITRSVPLLGRLASRVARLGSRLLYAATRGPRDEDCSGEHRHATHTLVFALVFGALVGMGTAATATRLELAGADELGLLCGAGMVLGCAVHCLGDALTVRGCPFLWPISILGETWYELRPPRLLRFRTGGAFEQFLVVPALTVISALLIPGVWPIAYGLLPGVLGA
ncbi:MAG: metal-dependent hydrolase [Pseudonocardiaceae bacterium]